MGARVRFNAVVAADDGSYAFEYTFYSFAPAVFMAREPTQQEKTALVQKLAAKYIPRVLSMKSFRCTACQRSAEQFVSGPMHLLHDPVALAVRSSLFPVCKAASCSLYAQRRLEESRQLMKEHFQVVGTWGPELLACGNCHKQGPTPLQRCGRCYTTMYCSRDCQKAHWKVHKEGCAARVEAAKLTPGELAQIDKYAHIMTKGTLELPYLNHPGQFPVGNDREKSLAASLLGVSTELAELRNRENRKLARARKLEKEADRESVMDERDILHMDAMRQLPGLRLDVVRLFH